MVLLANLKQSTTVLLIIASIFISAELPAQSKSIAIYGETIHTMAKTADGKWQQPISDGVVLIVDGKITAVGPQASVEVPEGALEMRGKVVTPGLIDARSVVGLAGWLNIDHDSDHIERSSPIQPELAALDAYNPREPLIEWVRSFGVTTLHTGHAPGQLISGQTFIVKTRGNSVDDAVVQRQSMVAATLGSDALRSGKESPGTRAKQMSMLRQKFIEAKAYQEKVAKAAADEEKDAPARDLRKEAMVQILEGKMPLMINAHSSVDIQNVLRLQKEWQIPVVLQGGAECYDFIEPLKAQGIPVILHPTMMRSSGVGKNASMDTAAKLIAAGVPVAMGSGYESYVPKTRVVLWEAAIACAYGCEFQDALGLITHSAAALLGIGDRVGSLEVGKDGDAALFDGDPFEYTSHCLGTVIEGEVVSDIAR